MTTLAILAIASSHILTALLFLALGHRMGRGLKPLPEAKPTWDELRAFLHPPEPEEEPPKPEAPPQAKF